MSDNYPPGVTGREPQIAGNPERRSVRRCASEPEQRLFGDGAMKYLQRARLHLAGTELKAPDPEHAARCLQKLHDLLLQQEPAERECEFEGPVLVELTEDGQVVWECPWCGTEHASNYDDEPDDDRGELHRIREERESD